MSKKTEATAVAPTTAKEEYLLNEMAKADKRYEAKLQKEAEKLANKGKPKVETAKALSKKVTQIVNKIENFDSENAGSYDKLGQTSRKVTVKAMNLKGALINFLETAKEDLTDKQMSKLNLSNCKRFIKTSIKYKDLQLFTTDDLKQICNKVLVKFDVNTKRAKKVAEQGGIVGNKANKLKVNSSK